MCTRVALIVACLIAGSSGILVAQAGPCDKAQTTLEMRQCLSAELRTADSTLAVVLLLVKAQVADSVARAIDEASVAWASYRTSECGALLASYEDGHEGPVGQLDCLVTLTEDRWANLKSLYSGLLRDP